MRPGVTKALLACTLVMCATSGAAGCRSVTRTPVSFATESYHARDNEEYRFAGWVSGESCEEGFFAPFGGVASGEPVWVRTFSGNAEVPRTVASALKKALKQSPNAVFLANVSVESEVRQGCLEPVRICTIVTGAAMEPSEMSKVRRSIIPDEATPSPSTMPSAPAADDDAPSRVVAPR
jgi:hypothetical protein